MIIPQWVWHVNDCRCVWVFVLNERQVTLQSDPDPIKSLIFNCAFLLWASPIIYLPNQNEMLCASLSGKDKNKTPCQWIRYDNKSGTLVNGENKDQVWFRKHTSCTSDAVDQALWVVTEICKSAGTKSCWCCQSESRMVIICCVHCYFVIFIIFNIRTCLSVYLSLKKKQKKKHLYLL